MNKIKTFLLAFGTGILTAFFFFFRRKDTGRSVEASKVQVERDQAEMKLKEVEAKHEIEKKFEGLSDADIVQLSIKEQLRSADESDSKGNKGSR